VRVRGGEEKRFRIERLRGLEVGPVPRFSGDEGGSEDNA
jgi:hypothetical protein